MTEKDFEEGHCPKCESQRADVIVEHKDEYVERSGDFVYYEDTYYRILKCRGCGKIYFKTLSTNSEDYYVDVDPDTGETIDEFYRETVQFWPPSSKWKIPDWADTIRYNDHLLGCLFADVYTALSNNLGVLAAIGMRTVFDRASELLEINPNMTFEKKLTALKDGGRITAKETDVLAVLVDAGSAAAHRAWQPKPNQLDGMVTILEGFLHRAFVLEEVAVALGKHVPKKQKKK